MKFCNVQGCEQPFYAKGLCNKHYLRISRRGSLELKYDPDRRCTVAGCDRKQRGRGLCDMHYQRMRANGTLSVSILRGAAAVQRILAKCARNERGCLVYTGRLTKKGYAHVRDDARKMRFAHVIMYEAKHGAVPEGLELDHLCRNRACCEPNHLEAVTHAVNMERSSAARRGEWDWKSRIRCEEARP